VRWRRREKVLEGGAPSHLIGPRMNTAVFAVDDGEVFALDCRARRFLALDHLPAGVCRIAAHPSSPVFAAACADGKAYLLSDTLDQVLAIPLPSPVFTVAFLPHVNRMHASYSLTSFCSSLLLQTWSAEPRAAVFT
jgi:hypothetical protein